MLQPKLLTPIPGLLDDFFMLFLFRIEDLVKLKRVVKMLLLFFLLFVFFHTTAPKRQKAKERQAVCYCGSEDGQVNLDRRIEWCVIWFRS